jgi:methylglyoxal synthase
LVIFFRDARSAAHVDPGELEMLRICDFYSVPTATNIATAEALIRGLDDGNLDWYAVKIKKFRKLNFFDN